MQATPGSRWMWPRLARIQHRSSDAGDSTGNRRQKGFPAGVPACYIVLMELPDIGRYRRRFIVEFGPEDSGLVDRLGEIHRTKRGAIIAGLRLLESGEVEQLRARVTGLSAQLDSARAAVETKAKADRETKPAAAAANTALREKREELAAARAEVRRVQTANAEVRRANEELDAELDRLVALLPHHAYCGYCDRLVPESEWAETEARNGLDVYHKPDGYRAKRTMGGAASVLFWRATPALSSEGG